MKHFQLVLFSFIMSLHKCSFVWTFQTHTNISEIQPWNYRGSNIFHVIPYLIFQQPLEICTIIFTILQIGKQVNKKAGIQIQLYLILKRVLYHYLPYLNILPPWSIQVNVGLRIWFPFLVFVLNIFWCICGTWYIHNWNDCIYFFFPS